jgi:RHS repeat-associated protein
MGMRNGDRDVRYSYGKNGELLRVFDNSRRLVVRYEYDINGRERARVYGNGVRQETEYDKAGRFTTVDPVMDGANWFAYVNNDPVNYTDPLGLQCISASDKISVTAMGSGIGGGVSIGAGPIEVINAEKTTVAFSIAETGKFFTADYYSVVEERGGISISAGIYFTSSESHKNFPAGTTPMDIVNDYAGKSTYATVSLGPFSISGTEDGGWSTVVVSVGLGWGASLATGDVVQTRCHRKIF